MITPSAAPQPPTTGRDAHPAATRREFFALLGAAGLLTGCSTSPDTGPAPADARGLDEVERSPLFRAIPAVRDGRYRRPSETDAQAIIAASPLCLDRALAALTTALR